MNDHHKLSSTNIIYKLLTGKTSDFKKQKLTFQNPT